MDRRQKQVVSISLITAFALIGIQCSILFFQSIERDWFIIHLGGRVTAVYQSIHSYPASTCRMVALSLYPNEDGCIDRDFDRISDHDIIWGERLLVARICRFARHGVLLGHYSV
ncbi:hypothetical protein ACEQPO_05420 [Bacillus sp. SL00103]